MEGDKKNKGVLFDKNNLTEFISVLKKINNQIFALHAILLEDFGFINQHLKDCHKIIKNINDSNYPLLNISDHIKLKNEDELTKLSLLIKEKTTECSSCFAQIITNLQYQDIINQRVEHIQSSHQELIDDLELLERDFEHTHIHIKAKSFMRFRDITGLQTAQLIHTNKLYRLAIENIIQGFKDVTRILELLKKIYEKMDVISPNSKINNEISSKISELNQNSELDFLNYVFFNNTCEAIIEGINEINNKTNTGFGRIGTANSEEHLKKLKEKYTMASEHHIHNIISKSNTGKIVLFDEESDIINLKKKQKEDDDNLELF